MSQLLSLLLSKAIREDSGGGLSRGSTKLSEFFDQSSVLSFVCALAGVEVSLVETGRLLNSPAILIASSLLEGNEGGDGNTGLE